MKKFIIALSFLSNTFILLAQAHKTISADSGIFLLHKFEQNIGKEKYTISRNDTSVVYNIDFKFIDRGSSVPLRWK